MPRRSALEHSNSSTNSSAPRWCSLSGKLAGENSECYSSSLCNQFPSIYIYTYIYIYICIHTYIYIYTMYIHIYTHTHLCFIGNHGFVTLSKHVGFFPVMAIEKPLGSLWTNGKFRDLRDGRWNIIKPFQQIIPRWSMESMVLGHMHSYKTGAFSYGVSM